MRAQVVADARELRVGERLLSAVHHEQARRLATLRRRFHELGAANPFAVPPGAAVPANPFLTPAPANPFDERRSVRIQPSENEDRQGDDPVDRERQVLGRRLQRLDVREPGVPRAFRHLRPKAGGAALPPATATPENK